MSPDTFAIAYTCPRCRKDMILPDHYAGRRLLCPACEQLVEVPAGKIITGVEADPAEE